MIPSIDYLTCVLAGAILLAGASNMLKDGQGRSGAVLVLIGAFLFIVGTVRAAISAVGL